MRCPRCHNRPVRTRSLVLMSRSQREHIVCAVCGADLVLDEGVRFSDVAIAWLALMIAAAPLAFGRTVLTLVVGVVAIGVVYRFAPWHGSRYRIAELPSGDETGALPVARLVAGGESRKPGTDRNDAVSLPPGGGAAPNTVPVTKLMPVEPAEERSPEADEV